MSKKELIKDLEYKDSGMIQDLNEQLEKEKAYLDELDELDPPTDKMVATWVKVLRSSEHIEVDLVGYNPENKKLLRQELLIEWRGYGVCGLWVPWKLAKYCDSYIDSMDFVAETDYDPVGYTDTEKAKEKEEYRKEIKRMEAKAEQCMGNVQHQISQTKEKITDISFKIFVINSLIKEVKK